MILSEAFKKMFPMLFPKFPDFPKPKNKFTTSFPSLKLNSAERRVDENRRDLALQIEEALGESGGGRLAPALHRRVDLTTLRLNIPYIRQISYMLLQTWLLFEMI